jgi:hypothetical protein
LFIEEGLGADCYSAIPNRYKFTIRFLHGGRLAGLLEDVKLVEFWAV